MLTYSTAFGQSIKLCCHGDGIQQRQDAINNPLFGDRRSLIKLEGGIFIYITTFVYRIAGCFRGTKFSRFSKLTLEPRKFGASKSLFTVGLWSNEPLSLENKIQKMFKFEQSVKIECLENNPLYGIIMITRIMRSGH